MNRLDLIEMLKKEAKLPKNKAKAAVDLLFDQMADALANGERIELRGFCSFSVKEYRSYTGRNPRSGEKIKVPPKKLPVFKPGKDLKERLNK